MKSLMGGLLLTAASAATLVAQDAMVMNGVVGGSSLPPGVAPAPVPTPAYSSPNHDHAPARPVPSASAGVSATMTAPTAYAAPALPMAASPMAAPNTAARPPVFVPATPAPAPVPSAGLAPLASASAGWNTESWAPQQLPVRRAEIPSETRGYFPGREGKTAPSLQQGQLQQGQLRQGLRGTQPVPSYRTAQVTGGSSLPPGVAGGSSLPPGSAPAPTSGGQPYPPQTQQPPRPRSWAEKLGLGNISTKVFGHVKGGAAARNEDSFAEGFDFPDGPGGGWDEEFVADAYLGAEVSAFTPGGIEYGLNVGLRGAYDGDGVLFGGQVGDCALGGVGCPGQAPAFVTGEPLALRGHTSQLFTGLRGFADEERVVLESAHLFLRTGYGDITLGRDVGAGELFSLGAPTLLQMGVNNGRVDYTTLDIVTTANDPTGYSEKITYTSPRLGGDIIGLSAQVGASYTPDVDACGTYTCFRRNGSDRAAGSVGATLEDAWEIAVSLERKLGDIDAEITGSYARANAEQSLAAFDDLESWNIGAKFEWGDFKLGGSYLESNNALEDGDYTAYDIGLTYGFEALGGRWGAGVGFAHAEDDNVQVESDQFQFGLTREVGRFNIGAGLQYIERTVPGATGAPVDEDATAIFIETGFDF